MRKTLQTLAALAGVLVSASGAALAQTGFSVGPSVGTDGIGADVFYKASPLVALRGGFRYGDFDLTRTIDDVRYDLDIGFTSGVAALDLHPFANGFRLSGGAYFSGRKVDLGADGVRLTALPPPPAARRAPPGTPPRRGRP